MTIEALKIFESMKKKIDFGCGPNKKQGFYGVDIIPFPNIDLVLNIGKDHWPWEDGSVEEAHASHFVEHLTAQERVHFVNELYRVLEPGGKLLMVTPHWASCRAYGDPTHMWPPVSEFWFFYLNKEWRKVNASHTDIEFNSSGFNCDFTITSGYSMRQDLITRNQEYQQFALMNYKEVAMDMIATFVKK